MINLTKMNASERLKFYMSFTKHSADSRCAKSIGSDSYNETMRVLDDSYVHFDRPNGCIELEEEVICEPPPIPVSVCEEILGSDGMPLDYYDLDATMELIR